MAASLIPCPEASCYLRLAAAAAFFHSDEPERRSIGAIAIELACEVAQSLIAEHDSWTPMLRQGSLSSRGLPYNCSSVQPCMTDSNAVAQGSLGECCAEGFKARRDGG